MDKSDFCGHARHRSLTHLINPLPGRRNRAKELGDEDVDRTAHSRGALNADFFRFGRDCHLPLFHK